MDPRDDENAFHREEPDDSELLIHDLQRAMVRLHAEIDQLEASSQERTAEIAVLRARLAELGGRIGAIRNRYRRNLRLWTALAALAGAALGAGLMYLRRM